MKTLVLIAAAMALFAIAAYAPLPPIFREYPEIPGSIGAVVFIAIASLWPKGKK